MYDGKSTPENLPKPMPKVTIPFSLQMLQLTGTDYSVCPKYKEGKMEIIASYLNHNGTLVNVKDLARQRIKNKSSPIKEEYKSHMPVDKSIE